MKRVLVFVAVLAVLAPFAGAAPSITSVGVAPSETLWMDEEFTLEAYCDANASSPAVTVTNVSVDTGDSSPKVVGTDLQMSQTLSNSSSDRYILQSSELLDVLRSHGGVSPGAYTFAVSCSTGAGMDTASDTFSLRRLDLSVDSGIGAGYTGERRVVTTTLQIERKGSPTVIDASGLGQLKWQYRVDDGSWKNPDHWYTNGNWKLNVSLPDTAGTHTLTFRAEYGSTEAETVKEVAVEEALEYRLSASSLTVSPGQTIELQVEAAHRGTPLRVETDDVMVRVDGDTVAEGVAEADVSDGRSTFTVTVPDMAPGTYPLTVRLEGYGAVEERDLAYPMRLSGTFADQDGDVPFELVFTEGSSRVASVSGRGDYAGKLLPGTYNVTAGFGNGRASAVFRDVDIDAWDDPLRYARYDKVDVPGLVLGGLYAFRTSLDYGTVELMMRYRTNNVENPDRMTVFKCGGWNFARAACFTDWEEVPADFNDVNSKVTVETSSLSAYAIGQRDALRVLHGHEREDYLPDDTVSFGGRVQDGDGDPVRNASVTLSISPGGVMRTVTTDGQGRYTFSVPVPDAEGTYTATVEVGKEPYADGSTTFSFGVERPPRLTVTAPESVTLRQNSSKGVDVFVKNTGYTVIDDMRAVTEDIPLFERVAYSRGPLERNESRRVTLMLGAGPNATPETRTAHLRFAYDGEETEHVFGVTVEEVTTVGATASSLTGNLPLSGARSAVVDAVPSGVPVTTIVFVVLLIQGSVVAFFFLRTRVGVEHPVIGTLRTARDELDSGGLFGGREPERENVLRAVDHIKEELDRS